MLDQLKQHLQEVETFKGTSAEDLERFRLSYLGKKGILNHFFAYFKTIPNEKKKEFGQQLNTLKNLVANTVSNQKSAFQISEGLPNKYDDLTRPPQEVLVGSRHPISIVKNEIIDTFYRIGFNIYEGPEIEDDWHNFSALNLPNHHPARDMQDTFFVQTSPDRLLRTHTSSSQIRYMESHKPPIRTLSPGRVFRNETISSRSHCLFHQVEGLYVGKEISFVDLKQTILYFVKKMFGNSKIRLRPSYFPFTEPSAEVDIYWGLNNEIDRRITKGTGWLEIMGCGMVDPNVLNNCGIDSKIYTGYAFGMGIERIAMLLYQIGDIRMFYENDVRFLEQFKTV